MGYYEFLSKYKKQFLHIWLSSLTVAVLLILVFSGAPQRILLIAFCLVGVVNASKNIDGVLQRDKAGWLPRIMLWLGTLLYAWGAWGFADGLTFTGIFIPILIVLSGFLLTSWVASNILHDRKYPILQRY